ncbi:Outer membrane protein beta-barrel domain-containing protein [Mucilaginibacter mallensis]|uniref:Outer membrane protein beta-barrel domain-containing protein n=1 Tax=Mucilaginibacter mallensis TaxID=652787 RepID=A0A1H2C0B4_MUCMA|nr:outer membrane beta-barrel protein [Mucilaginibacter mallensis]SDT63737.1 Outer membrane protein beta-barrel domain-containing protein [Mucilaginibacter mallensis]
MKDSAWYNKLWQTKMQELPLEGDEHAAWQKMQGLLDQHMPVSSPVVVPKPATKLWVKLLYVLVAIITAAIIYYAASYMLADHHEKTNKAVGKHALINADSAANNSYSAKEGSTDDKPTSNAGNGAKNSAAATNNDEKRGYVNSSGITSTPSATINGKLAAGTVNKINIKPNGNNNSSVASKISSGNNIPAANHPATNGTNIYRRADIKHNSNNTSATNKVSSGNNNSSGIDNVMAYGTNIHSNKTTGHLTAGGGRSVLTNSRSGLSVSQKQGIKDHTTHSPHLNQTSKNVITSQNNQQLLADQTASAQTNLTPRGNGIITNGATIKDVAQNLKTTPGTGNKTDSSTATKNTATKPTADTNAKNQPDKSTTKNKTTSAKKPGNSKFELDVKLGANTNTGSSINPFLGVSANYNFHKKWGVSIGVNAPYTRIITGSYSKSNLTYVTVGDSNKQITHNSGKLTISSSRKIQYVDIPMLATYKVSDKLTITAGPVISIPIKANACKNTLGALSSSADTTTLKEVTPYVTSTTINSKVNFSFSAGARYNVKRFYFDAGYLQGVSPYTVSSSLGSGKIYYHTIQIGIGYQLFKSKSK